MRAHLCTQAAYLALTQFFDQNHELVLLLVNTLLSDLKNDNFINGACAMHCAAWVAARQPIWVRANQRGRGSAGTASAVQRSSVAEIAALSSGSSASVRLVCTLTLVCGCVLRTSSLSAVGTALVVCTKLIGPDLINAVYPLVIDRLKHPKEHVRKKAIMALHRYAISMVLIQLWHNTAGRKPTAEPRTQTTGQADCVSVCVRSHMCMCVCVYRFYQLDPRREGPLAGLEIDKHLRTMLCDKVRLTGLSLSCVCHC